MKFILLSDIYSYDIDAVFGVPDNITTNDVDLFIQSCRKIADKNDISVLEVVQDNLPNNWFYSDQWGSLKTIYY